MRFDLTHAAFRVLKQAAEWQFPGTAAQIYAGKLLIALFHEDECRAAGWLAEAGVTQEQFFAAFELPPELSSSSATIATLQSPITAPSFPRGDYGVPPLPPSFPKNNAYRVAATQRDGHAKTVEDFSPQKLNVPKESEKNHDAFPLTSSSRSQSDQWVSVEPPQKHLVLYPQFPSDLKRQSLARFYVDDQPVNVGALSAELEEAFFTVLQLFSQAEKNDLRRRIPSSGGGATLAEQSDRLSTAGVVLGTEHLLLAIVLDSDDVGNWLREQGFDSGQIYERILALHAVSPPSSLPDEHDLNDHHVFTEISAASAFSDAATHKMEQKASDSHSQKPSFGMARLMDAAANRAHEGLRVLEDFVRFVLNHADLTQQFKDFRHELQEALRFLPIRQRLESRNAEQDVGTILEAKNEYRRDTLEDVLNANFSRLQESLRSLEEFSKVPLRADLGNSDVARRFENLRYQCYTLHKSVAVACSSEEPRQESSWTKSALATSQLYALLDCRETSEDFAAATQALLAGGATIIQLRDKKADDRKLLQRAVMLRKQMTDYQEQNPQAASGLLIINDRPDLAMLVGADGVHVGQEEIPCEKVRQLVGSEMIVGISTHNMEQARQAVLDGADYIGVGPVFPSATKTFDSFQNTPPGIPPSTLPGTDFLRKVSADMTIPAFAIGGISLENLDQILEAGIQRVALSSALLNAADIQQATAEFVQRLAETKHENAYSDN